MLEGLYSAASGMAAQQQRMDALANDVANVNTAGYKRVRVGFRDLIYQRAGRGANPNVDIGTGAAAATIGRGAAEGSLQDTGNALDLAIDGPGFFQVRLAGGQQALTRAGNFHLDRQGRVVNAQGARLGITVPAGTSTDDIEIAPTGAVTVKGRAAGQINVVAVTSPDGLRAAGDNLFQVTAASGPARRAGGAQVLQGKLEMSNVQLADAMTEMLDAQRSYELASKAIHMQDEMLGIANGVKR